MTAAEDSIYIVIKKKYKNIFLFFSQVFTYIIMFFLKPFSLTMNISLYLKLVAAVVNLDL